MDVMHKTSPPKVIACLPSYNAEGFIKETLLSLKKQNYSNFKVLISDDCSTDNTVSVIQSIIKNDERFVLIQQETNLGWVDNINFLMGKAVNLGEYIFIMPHDDYIKFNYLQKLAYALEKNPKAVLAYSDMECIFSGGKSNILQYYQLNGISDRKKRTKILLQLIGYWGTAYRGITRRSAVNKIIPLKKSTVGRRDYALDWIWLIKLSLQGEFLRIPEVLYKKFYHFNSASYLWDKKNDSSLIRFVDSNLNFFGLLLNCSRTLWQSHISFQEKSFYQITIFVLGSKRLIIDNGLLMMKLVYKKIILSINKEK